MSLVRTSLPSLLREADRVLSTRRHAAALPAVIWAGLDEDPLDFAQRVVVLRRSRPGRILAAVPHAFPVPAGAEPVEFAPKMFRLIHPSRPSRYRCASGGRGSGKSHGLATAVILRMIERRMRVLCCREIMHSLRESVHHLLVAKIDALGLAPFFEITDRSIVCTATDAEVILAGLFANINSLKSLENIGLCWTEEGESVSARSLEVLAPTIRSAGSEIWLSLNPTDAAAPAMEFVGGTRDDTLHEHFIFSDNPYFPTSLEGERLYLQRVDDDAYRHVWLGECRSHSDAQVFRGKFVAEDFVPLPEFDGPYYGADWGFSSDPSTLVRCWVHERRLYVDYEAYEVGCDIDRTPALFDTVPDARRHTIRADSARPETISYMQRNGYPNVTAVEKWSGSVEDGIAFLRQFEKIVAHPRCVHVLEELRLYRYKVDRLTGDVLPNLIDANNHTIDSLRYALSPLIKSPSLNLFLHLKSQYEKLQRGEAVTHRTRETERNERMGQWLLK